MSTYYPQAAVKLIVIWETFDNVQEEAQQRALESEAIRNPAAFEVQAKSVTVDINDYTQADTFALTIDYNQFPFDPRTMRSVQVTIAMEDMRSRERIRIRDKLGDRDSNIVFIGFADTQEISFDDRMREVYLEGRDYTGLLLDTSRILVDKRNAAGDIIGVKRAPRLRLAGKRVDIAFNSLLREKLAFRGLSVEVRLGGQKTPNLGKDGNKINNASYWHIIEKYISNIGLIAYMEVDKLVITNPRNLFATDQQRLVQMVYGANLSKLAFNRYIGRQKTFNIRVTSRQRGSKTILRTEMPKDAVTARFKNLFGVKDEQTGAFKATAYQERVPTANGTTQKVDPEYQYFTVTAVDNINQLKIIAEKLYENVSRQHLEGYLQTKEMRFIETKGIEESERFISLVRAGRESEVSRERIAFSNLRIGTALQVIFDQVDMNAINTMSEREARLQYLLSRGYSNQVASTLADALTKLSYRFFTIAVSYTLSESEGFKLNVDFINYVETDKPRETLK